jgi:DNA (cytosine-5)-methyltransferase 1
LTDQEYSNHSDAVIEKFTAMLKTKKIPDHLKTKKFSQRLLPERWGPNGPSITATSLADDYVHFSQPRVLTVREWARLQMFPDWYEFSGKRTTGGRRRAGDPEAGDWTREVPKYTQIGNAVPVELARQLGLHLREIL